MLDAAGLPNATISVSNDLDEYVRKTLTDANAPVNTWGVGTQMVTGGKEAAFTGVYKLAASDDGKGKFTARIKFSDNPAKTTNPGVKQVWRVKDKDGMCVADVLALEDPEEPDILEKGRTYSFWHPQADYRRFSHTLDQEAEGLLKERFKNGKLITESPALSEIQNRVYRELESLDGSYKRFLNPHIYKVSVTERLRALKLELIKSYLGDL
jgi:nicotinate phosphoribosyltransferase